MDWYMPDRRAKFDDAGLLRLRALSQPGQTFSAAQIANECGVTRQQVERIEQGALRKLAIRMKEWFSEDEIQELKHF